jgi:mRNA interferase HigB
MRIIAKRTLRSFWELRPDSKRPLQQWHELTKHADWPDPASVRATFRSVDFVAGNRAIFDVGGNRFRVVAKINYPYRIVYIRFVGSHSEYDRIDPETI